MSSYYLPDADMVDTAVAQTRVQLLGPQHLQVLHDEGPELDDVVSVHGVT